ncbi:MAG TPA: hypothetical protein VFZ69_12940 [Longimicrobiales bacterium]
MLLLLAGGAAEAQNAPVAGWNSERALELIARARARRLLPQQDTALRNYTARAEGFVYFYLDRRDGSERTLVKVDQVALELFWAPPDRTRQRIVGLRDVSRLPNRMHYHLDHLTVVQNGFGDVIRMGDGDEVRDVPHPAAPGSESVYEFRLADSLTLQLPSMASTIRVYEIEVRPLDPDRAALVGSVFVDRASADIVRMTFTFTPASYVDRRLDYISVSLDNGLWEGRYWLPNEQTLQIRRQIPELDFGAGAVIQGRMRIADYRFNDSLAPATVVGRLVTAVPEAEREAYAFEREIFDDLNDAGLAPPPDLSEIRRRAAELLGARRLSGLPRLRLGIGSASSALRYNRAEGVAVGVGVTYAPDPGWRLDLEGGFAFGPERPWAALDLGGGVAPATRASVSTAFRDVHDVGIAPALPGAVNTLSSVLLGRDYTDPYYATGARLRFARRIGGRLDAGVELVAERHESATRTQSASPLDESSEFRGVRAVDEVDLGALVMGVQRPMPDPRADDWSAAVEVEIGSSRLGWYARPTARLALRRATADHARTLALDAAAGFIGSDAPSQRLYVLGGLGTLPGYPFRSFAGRRFALLQAEADAAVFEPWLRLRLVAAAGAAGGLPVPPALPGPAAPAWHLWPVAGSDGIRTSAGAGISLLWDLLRLDAVRGLNGGSWRFIISFRPELGDVS